MKNKVLRISIAILLIIAMTISDFAFLGMNIIAYAAGNASDSTNHENVKFATYFKTDKGEKVSEIKYNIDDTNMKLYMEVAVQKQGYFDGVITLNNSNFNIKPQVLTDSISKIENNTITLNRITAGNTAKIELSIEPITVEDYNLNLLNMQSNIALSGTYKDSTEKDINIKAEKSVSLNLVAPENLSTSLEAKLITNRIYKIGEESKRLVQIEVKSSVVESAFPIKSSRFVIEAIPGLESVQVLSKGTYATNGKAEQLLESNSYQYDSNNNTVSFTIENQANNGKISWKKGGVDTIIVTFVLDDEANLPEKEYTVNSLVSFYGESEKKIENNKTYTLQEADGILKTTVTNEETYMYKGKIYSKQEREYNTTTNIEVNYANLAKNIQINQTTVYETEANEKASNIEYKTTTISKAELEKILGSQGKITIKDQNGNVIREITASSEADQNGNFVINYAGGVKSLNIEMTTPVNVGILRLSHTKVIKPENYSRADIQAFNSLNEKVVTKYNSTANDTTENLAEYEYTRKMGLNETKTQVDVTVEPRTLSTVATNEQVKIAMTLRTNEERYDLFKNPTLTIKLPDSVKDVSNMTVTPLYLDGFEIQSNQYLPETREIKLVLKGENLQYTTSNTQGYIEILADIDLEETTPNGLDKISLTYTNENASTYDNDGKKEVTVQISGLAGLIAYNNIISENIKTNSFLTTEEKLANLPVNAGTKRLSFQTILLNNSASAITSVTVKGVLPLKGKTELGENNIDSSLTSKILVNNPDAKVYYTSNGEATTDLANESNGWNEDINSVQNPVLYMIIIPEIASRQRVEATYEIQIPARLEYNKTLKTSYTVDYLTDQGQRRVVSAVVGATTGVGADLVATLNATVGADILNEQSTVKAGEVIEYTMSVTNKGNAEAHNVKIVGLVPEGTVYVKPMEDFVYANPVSLYYDEFEDIKQIEQIFDNIGIGETKTVVYEVRVKSDTTSGVAANKVTATADNAIEVSSNEMSNKLEAGNIRVTVKRRTDLSVIPVNKQMIRYFAIVENISNSEAKNVELQLNIPEELNLIQIDDSSNGEITESESKITIDSIPAGQSRVYELYTQLKDIEELEKLLNINAIATYNGSQYRSNAYKEMAYGYDVKITMTGTHEGEYLKPGDVIDFDITVINNSKVSLSGYTVESTIPEQLSIEKIQVDNIEQTVLDPNYFTIQVGGLEAGKSTIIKITATVRNSLDRSEVEKISTVANLMYAGEIVQTTEPPIVHFLEAINEQQPDIPDLPENPDNPDNPPVDPDDPDNPPIDPDDPDNPPVNPEKNKYNISGKAWVDQDKNGHLDNNDTILSNIVVRLLNIETNEFVRNDDGNKDLTVTTDKEGFYSFEGIEEGKYIVVFEYDNTLYKPTMYQKYGVEESKNSNVASKTLSINGEEKEYATTDELELNKNISNINLGLVFIKQFDIQIDKYVSKIIVQTSNETRTYEYNNQAELARVEISARRIVGATIIVQYTIKATNLGDVDAYINSLVDYAPNSLKFSSELNTDWYESEGNLYTNSLAKTAIAPGQSKEVTLTLTQTKTDGNAELINNTAEIQEAYNIYGIADMNSTQANKNLDENDLGSADVLVSIQTGSAFNYITLVISMLAVIGVGVYLINKKILHFHLRWKF